MILWEQIGKEIRYLMKRLVVLLSSVFAFGSECILILNPDNPELLEAINYYPVSVERASLIYHYHRIASTLFPYNFPVVEASVGANYDELSKEQMIRDVHTGTARQRIFGRPIKHYRYDYNSGGLVVRLSNVAKRFVRKERDVKYPLHKAFAKMKELGFVPEIDKQRGNFVISNDGGEYYIENFKNVLGEFDPEKTKEYMIKKGFGQEHIGLVIQSTHEITQLRKHVGCDQPNPRLAIIESIEG